MSQNDERVFIDEDEDDLFDAGEGADKVSLMQGATRTSVGAFGLEDGDRGTGMHIPDMMEGGDSGASSQGLLQSPNFPFFYPLFRQDIKREIRPGMDRVLAYLSYSLFYVCSILIILNAILYIFAYISDLYTYVSTQASSAVNPATLTGTSGFYTLCAITWAIFLPPIHFVCIWRRVYVGLREKSPLNCLVAGASSILAMIFFFFLCLGLFGGIGFITLFYFANASALFFILPNLALMVGWIVCILALVGQCVLLFFFFKDSTGGLSEAQLELLKVGATATKATAVGLARNETVRSAAKAAVREGVSAAASNV